VTKPLAVDELNQALREKSCQLWDAATVSELRSFVRDESGKMKGSPFDDRTISLSIAWQMTKYVWLQQYDPVSEPGPGTMAYMEKKLYGDDILAKISRRKRPFEPEPIGKHWVRDPITQKGRV
jgi:hypothetical protein